MCPAGAAAQARVTGRVVDAASGAPVERATVTQLRGGATTVTGSDGGFVLPVREGDCTLRVAADGYELITHACEGTPALTVALPPSALRLHESLVVTASREPASTWEAPRAVSLVDRRDLDAEWPRTTPEALMDVPGLYVQKTNHGGGSPILRGLMGNQVLVLVDGIRLNNSTYRYGPNQYLATVDPGSIERVEVLRGSGSVLFGSDAMGGVVHVLTRDPREVAPGVSAEGRARLVSAGMERSARVDLAGGHGPLRFVGGVAARDYGDLRAGGSLGVESPSAYTELNGEGRLSVQLGSSATLLAAYQHVRQDDVPRFDQVRQRGFARYAFDPQVRQLAYGRVTTVGATAWAARTETTISWQHTRERRVRQRAGDPVLVTEEDRVENVGAAFQGVAAPLAHVTVRYGAEAALDRIGSMRRDRNVQTGASAARRGLYPDGATAWTAAGFAHGTWSRGRALVEAGGRYTWTGLRATDVTFGAIDLSPSAWVGNAGGSVAISQTLRAYVQVAQSFRAPNVDDVSALGAFDFGIEVPSPSLSPERGVEVEGGIKLRAGRVSAAAAAYRLTLDDLIDRVRGTLNGADTLEGQAVYRRANTGRAVVRGVEAEAQVALATGWMLRAHVTGTHGQQTTAGHPMRRIPPANGLVALRRTLGGGWLEAAARAASAQRRLAPGDRDDHRIAPGGTPSWATLDVRGGIALARQISLTAAVENLTNAAYRIHGSGIDEPGRHAWIALHTRF